MLFCCRFCVNEMNGLCLVNWKNFVRKVVLEFNVNKVNMFVSWSRDFKYYMFNCMMGIKLFVL